MALLLEGVLFLLLVGLFFIIRLYIVVKTGPKQQPGTRGPVAVVVVAGSGNVNNSGSWYFRYVWFSVALCGVLIALCSVSSCDFSHLSHFPIC